MIPYGTLWYLMVPYGTLWHLMVPYGTLWYHTVPYLNLKPKSIITRRRIVRFNDFLTKMTEISLRFFSRGQIIKIPL